MKDALVTSQDQLLSKYNSFGENEKNNSFGENEKMKKQHSSSETAISLITVSKIEENNDYSIMRNESDGPDVNVNMLVEQIVQDQIEQHMKKLSMRTSIEGMSILT